MNTGVFTTSMWSVQTILYTLPRNIPCLIKGRSSHLMREDYPHLRRMPSPWTRATFYGTAGCVSQETIQHYIEGQSRT